MKKLDRVPLRRALISVYDKTNLAEFARGLHEAGVKLVSTGSTASTIAAAGVPVTEVTEVTEFPECLEGRVKTLHPRIHAGILADRRKQEHIDTLDELDVEAFDLVVVNLYPFVETVASGAGQDAIIEKAPWVDVVFGTHNIGSLPALLERARHNHEAQAELLESLEVFPSTLPTKRDHVYSGWVSISVGCNNTCTFCIVPSLRGKEKDRRPGDILAEVQALVDDGAIEVTLLGQNVNSYGVEFGDRQAFSKLLRACGEIEGLERVRFTSPHPAMFTDDVIDAMAETPNVMPVLHMPLQSGSDKVLKDMRRSYRSKKFLNILDKVRERIPNAVITTDIIVGFPGETEEDFQDTLKVVEQARFSSAFTFQYSIRPGTPAATMENQIPKEVVQERYERLIALQDRIAGEENRKQLGKTVELMVVAEAGRKADQTHRLSGRGPDQRLVHFSVPEGCETPRPGDMVTVPITEAGSFHLISDPTAEQYQLRRTRAGDAWDRSQADSCGTGTTQVPGAPVGLGMPTIGLRP